MCQRAPFTANFSYTDCTLQTVRDMIDHFLEQELYSMGLPDEDTEYLILDAPDPIGRLLWTGSSWYLPVCWIMDQDFTHPPSFVLWTVRDAAIILGAQEEVLKRWAQEMIQAIPRGWGYD